MRAILPLFLLVGLGWALTCVPQLQWSTKNGQILVNGDPFVLKGVSYFGFETETYSPHGMWSYSLDSFLNVISKNDFNAIRVPFSMEMLRKNPGNLNINCGANPDTCKLSALDLLNVFIDKAADRGLLIMLDNHHITGTGGISELWYNDEYPEDQVIALWKSLLQRVKDKWNVFAIDLKNEPHDAATWGSGNAKTDWNSAAERFIRAFADFKGLYFVEGIEWATRLEAVADHPINTGNPELNNRVVYSPHCYGPSVYDRPEFQTSAGFPNNLQQIYTNKYGFIPAKTGNPVVVGEWGGKATGSDEAWNNYYVQYLRKNCLTNTFYWCLNPNSIDTGGLLEDDWKTPIDRKLKLAHDAQPNPTKFKNQNGQVCITPGEFPDSQCRSGQAPVNPPQPAPATPKQPAPQPSPAPAPAPQPNPPQGGASGVTVQLVKGNAWQENGVAMTTYTVKLTNNSGKQICKVTLSIDKTPSQSWNLESAGGSSYNTPAWLRLANSASSSDPGIVVAGAQPTVSVISVQNC